MRKGLVFTTPVILLLVLTLPGCLPGYGVRAIPPSVEYLVPPEPEKVEYLAISPDDLAKRLFSIGASEQSREDAWSNARGKWVVWRGDVHDIAPKLKPSRVVFLHEYEVLPMSFDSGQFGIIVEFDHAWTEHLRQLTIGQTVFYRAKLVRRKTGLFGKYGLGLGSGFLMLEDGQIIDSNAVTAKLVDLAYTTRQQLKKLVKEAENIATARNFFQQRLERLGGKWGAIQAILTPLSIRIPDSPTPRQTILVGKQKQRIVLQAKIEANLENVLTSLHTAAPAQENYLREYIQEALETNRKLASEIDRYAEPLKKLWQKARQSSVAGLGDLLEAIIGRLHPIIGAFFITEQALNDFLERKPIEQAIIASYILLQKIDEHMEQISENVVGACQLVYSRL